MENLQIRKLSKIQTSFQDDLQFINDIQKERGLPLISKNIWESSDNNWVVYGGFIEDKIVCITFLFPYYRIPHNDYPYGYVAELGGTYTLPKYRNKGFASKVIKEMLANVKEDLPLLDAIIADSTDDGYPIYKRFGFMDGECHRIWKNKF